MIRRNCHLRIIKIFKNNLNNKLISRSSLNMNINIINKSKKTIIMAQTKSTYPIMMIKKHWMIINSNMDHNIKIIIEPNMKIASKNITRINMNLKKLISNLITFHIKEINFTETSKEKIIKINKRITTTRKTKPFFQHQTN